MIKRVIARTSLRKRVLCVRFLCTRKKVIKTHYWRGRTLRGASCGDTGALCVRAFACTQKKTIKAGTGELGLY